MKKKERKKSIEKEERRDLSHVGQRWVTLNILESSDESEQNLLREEQNTMRVVVGQVSFTCDQWCKARLLIWLKSTLTKESTRTRLFKFDLVSNINIVTPNLNYV